MGKQTGLGRGFDSLLPEQFDSSILLEKGEEVRQVPVTSITPNPHQPRKHFDEVSLQELALSIKQHGIVQPLVVTPVKDGKYELIAGERRWRAAQISNLKTVPAIIRSSEELEKLEIGLVENVQRVDLSPLEQATSIAKLHEQFNLSYKEIAKKLGKAPTTINNIVRLLQLPEEAREALAKRKISEGHARAILSLKADPEDQKRLLDLIIRNSWSVRQAEKYATAVKSGISKKKAVSKRVATETKATKALSQKLGTKVTIQHTAKGGKIQIHFNDEKDLKRLLTDIKLNK